MADKKSDLCEHKLQGEINFENALQLRMKVESFIEAAAADTTCELDFSAVTDTKSVTLSLLTAWSRYAINCKKNLKFVNVKPKLRQLIHLCCLEKILAKHLS